MTITATILSVDFKDLFATPDQVQSMVETASVHLARLLANEPYPAIN